MTLPALVDLILVGMVCEAGWLIWQHNRADVPGLPPLLLHVGSGFLLLLVMKLILQGRDLSLAPMLLGLAGVTHFFDIRKILSKP